MGQHRLEYGEWKTGEDGPYIDMSAPTVHVINYSFDGEDTPRDVEAIHYVEPNCSVFFDEIRVLRAKDVSDPFVRERIASFGGFVEVREFSTDGISSELDAIGIVVFWGGGAVVGHEGTVAQAPSLLKSFFKAVLDEGAEGITPDKSFVDQFVAIDSPYMYSD